MSEALPSVLHARERAQRYWEADGFYAIVSGLAWTMFGFAIFLSHPPFHLIYGETGGDALILAASLLLLLANRITEWLKVRLTYPRTGYVASPQEIEVQINEKAFPPCKPTRDEMVDNILTATSLLLIFGLFLDQRWMIGLFTLCIFLSPGISATVSIFPGTKSIRRQSWVFC